LRFRPRDGLIMTERWAFLKCRCGACRITLCYLTLRYHTECLRFDYRQRNLIPASRNRNPT